MNVVFDLDGTLADCGHRMRHIWKEPKDWPAFFRECSLDPPIPEVIAICRALHAAGHHIQIWSGRSDEVAIATRTWLELKGVPYHQLLLRPAKDHREDHVVKEEWLRNVSIGWRPDLVFEDRRRVVDMWRRYDIRCIQVAAGEF